MAVHIWVMRRFIVVVALACVFGTLPIRFWFSRP